MALACIWRCFTAAIIVQEESATDSQLMSNGGGGLTEFVLGQDLHIVMFLYAQKRYT